MEELEAVELNKSFVLENNKSFRIDDEYFNKRFLKTINLLKGVPNDRLINLSYLITDFGAFSQMNFVNYIDEGIPFIRNQNVAENFIDLSDVVYVNEKTYKKLSLKLEENDILIPRAGSLGNASVVDKRYLPATANQNLAQIKPNTEKIKPHYLTTFLCSRYGLNQIERVSTGNVQQWLNLENIKNIRIPLLTLEFQNKIQTNILRANAIRDKVNVLYKKAENILLQEIGLQDFKANTEAVNVKSFSESFAISGRLDAEYYQKKYEDVVNKVILQNHDTLNNLVSISKSVEPGSANYVDEGLPFIRVADYSKFGLTKPNKNISLNYVTANADKIKKLKPKKGTILFSKDGSVGTAYHLREDFNGITSGAILHLKVKDETKVVSEYLTLALNSKVVKMQAERDAGGSIILHWRVGEIENVVVPIIDFNKQKQIAKLVEESFKLKKESEYLLEVAKVAVEVAIEQNETKALKYIADNTSLA